MLRKSFIGVFIPVVFSLMLFSACTSVETNETFKNANDVVLKEVPIFHLRYNSDKIAAIWDSSAKNFKDSITKQNFIQLMGNLKRKYGNQTHTRHFATMSTETTTGAQSRVVYDTVFEHGKARETFVWKVEPDSQPTLMVYGFQPPK